VKNVVRLVMQLTLYGEASNMAADKNEGSKQQVFLATFGILNFLSVLSGLVILMLVDPYVGILTFVLLTLGSYAVSRKIAPYPWKWFPVLLGTELVGLWLLTSL